MNTVYGQICSINSTHRREMDTGALAHCRAVASVRTVAGVVKEAMVAFAASGENCQG